MPIEMARGDEHYPGRRSCGHGGFNI